MAPNYSSNGSGLAPTADDHTLANLLTTMAQQQPLPKKRESTSRRGTSNSKKATEEADAVAYGLLHGHHGATATAAAAHDHPEADSQVDQLELPSTSIVGATTIIPSSEAPGSLATEEQQASGIPVAFSGAGSLNNDLPNFSMGVDPAVTSTINGATGTTTSSSRHGSRASSTNNLDADYEEDNDDSATFTTNTPIPTSTVNIAATNGKPKAVRKTRGSKKDAANHGSGSNGGASTSTAATASNIAGGLGTVAGNLGVSTSDGNLAVSVSNGDDADASGEKLHTEQEWNRTRKDNHKEVERRRRETINEGINELKKIVPGCEKNKGSILSRAVEYIQQLKDSEATLIEKWTLEKLLSDQLTNDLRRQLEEAQREGDRLKEELGLAARMQNGVVNPEALQNGKRSDFEQGGSGEPKRTRLA